MPMLKKTTLAVLATAASGVSAENKCPDAAVTCCLTVFGGGALLGKEKIEAGVRSVQNSIEKAIGDGYDNILWTLFVMNNPFYAGIPEKKEYDRVAHADALVKTVLDGNSEMAPRGEELKTLFRAMTPDALESMRPRLITSEWDLSQKHPLHTERDHTVCRTHRTAQVKLSFEEVVDLVREVAGQHEGSAAALAAADASEIQCGPAFEEKEMSVLRGSAGKVAEKEMSEAEIEQFREGIL